MIEFRLDELYKAKIHCNSCKLRKGCMQVVPGIGCRDNPILIIIGDGPDKTDDEEGEPFIGPAGECLRTVLRATKIITRSNTLLTNVLGCRPPKNKFPSDDPPDICVSRWLSEEIRLAKPQRMLLLGGTPLRYVADMDGITKARGQWYTVRGIRTMATYHPSFVLRKDKEGMMNVRAEFERDIHEVAREIAEIQKGMMPKMA